MKRNTVLEIVQSRRASICHISRAVIAFASASMLCCSGYPTDSTGRDLLELESVWQYLKVYSIWQDKVPQTAFAYASPGEMLLAIDDTLKGGIYTEYYYGFHAARIPFGTVSQIANSAPITVGWDSLTDSTALIQISQFSEEDSSTYYQFKRILPRIAKFPKIIVDLIHNLGGGIAPTDAIINAILPLNTPYILERYRNYDYASRTAATIPGDNAWDTIKAINGQDFDLRNKRYAVLTNDSSASAAEIMVAALKDGFPASKGDTVVLVGETTYGKGIGQVLLSRNSIYRQNLKITFMRMRGISNRVGDYMRKGIPPDIFVPINHLDPLHIAQKNAALKILQPSARNIVYRPLLKQSNPINQFPPEAVIVVTPENCIKGY